jgi:hypothetical protein
VVAGTHVTWVGYHLGHKNNNATFRHFYYCFLVPAVWYYTLERHILNKKRVTCSPNIYRVLILFT